MRFLIGITGTMGSGKSTASEYLVKKYNFENLRISGKMREIAQDLEIKPSREFLQGIGKFMRDFDDDVWIRYIVKKIRLINEKSIVIDDIRRMNEIEYLKPLGFKFIRIDTSSLKRKARIETREGKKISSDDWKIWGEHLTENQVLHLPIDYIITNENSIDNLKKQIDSILQKISFQIGQ